MADDNDKIEEITEIDAEAPAAEAEVEEAPVAEETPAAEAEEAPAAEKVPAITTAKTPSQRKAERQAARHAAASTQTSRTAEERQAERDAIRVAKGKARTLRRGQERAAYKASEHERVPTPPREHVAGIQKTRQGIVVSDKAAKTITVRIDDARPHRKYRKIVRTSTTVHAHDELDNANLGDTVVVQECRPLSATKRWRLIEVVERAR